MNSTTLGWRVTIVTGATLALLACAAAGVDLANNYAFGITISPMFAAVTVIAAIGVIVIPAVATILGWCWLKRIATAAVVAMTVWCAWNAYGTSQGNSALAAQTRQEQYLKAVDKEKRAKAVLENIKETGDAEELGKAANEADTKLAEAEAASKHDCKKPRSDACSRAAEAKKQAEAERKLARERSSQAKARDKAKVDLAEAEAKSATGAALVREESPVLTWLGILLTQAVALLGGEGAALIGAGWSARPARALKPRKAAAPVPPRGGKPEPLPDNVTHLHQHSVKAWLDGATQGGGELRGGEALKAYKRWAGRTATDMTAKELRSILTALCGSAVEVKTSGYVVRGISLRAAGATQAKAAASC
ncbi:MAG: hypothetical protein ACLPPF_02275 [Rhodomicrobium sp.]